MNLVDRMKELDAAVAEFQRGVSRPQTLPVGDLLVAAAILTAMDNYLDEQPIAP